MRSDVEQAVTLLKEGDEKSLEKALSFLQRAVFAFGMRVCGHREDAEDTAQEVLVKAIPYLPKFDNSRALAKWLYTVAKNRCLMSRRRSKFAPKQELSLDELMPDREELEQINSSSIPQSNSSLKAGSYKCVWISRIGVEATRCSICPARGRIPGGLIFME